MEKISGRIVSALAAAAALAGGAAWAAGGSWPRALAVLLALFPLGLWLSTRRLWRALSWISRETGVEFLGPRAFGALARCRTLITCKTGVLTEGRLEVAHFLNNVGEGRDAEAFAYAAAAERAAGGSFAKAILAYCEPRESRRLEAESASAHPGEGVSAEVDGKKICLGTFAFVQRHGLDLRRLLRDPTSRPVSSRAYLAVGGRLYGIFYLEDRPRLGLASAVAALQAAGVEVLLASGDTDQVADFVALPLGITRVHAGLPPEGKKKLVEELRAQGHRVVALGNGAGDAPALQSADVAVSDLGELAGEGALCSPLCLERTARAILLSRRARRIALQNLAAGIFFHALAAPAAWLALAGPAPFAAAAALLPVMVLVNWRRLSRGVAREGAARPSRLSRLSKERGGGHVVSVEIEIVGSLDEELARAVAASLRAVPGVEDAAVQLDPPKVLVRCDRRYATVTLLRNAVRANGLRVGASEGRPRMDHYADIEEDFKVVS